MQIVIDITEEIYKHLLSRYKYQNIDDIGLSELDKVGVSIKNGTPLPEKHGRLGDFDALEEYFRNVRKELKASDYKSGIEFFVRDEMLLNVQQFIHLCDAIIEEE